MLLYVTTAIFCRVLYFIKHLSTTLFSLTTLKKIENLSIDISYIDIFSIIL